ncbi:MAG: ABC transporter substrate-binding protein [Oscillospiraceae bacterium]|nr:ABC transporter substrate-binding protein [Oscillospiraceae bacterium]
MKKTIIIILALILLLAGCQGGALKRLEEDGFDFSYTIENTTGSTAVYVYNWGEYMNEDLNAAFEAVTGIKVHYDTFQTNEALRSKLITGGSNYDVIIPSDYMIGLLIEEGLLEELDFSNIPNFADIKPHLKNPAYDPGNRYSVPYMWGTVGIIYDTTRVSGPVDSWGVLFDERYTGQILMFDNARDTFGIALKLLGYSFNTENEDELLAAYELLARQKPLVQAYIMDQIFDKMEVGEAILAPYYAGDALLMMESNADLAFAVPKEGSNIFTDAFVIPKGAANKAAAEMYINFMCSFDAAMANVLELGYSTPLTHVYDALELDEEEYAISYPEDLSLFEPFLNMPHHIRELYDSLWIELLR